MISNAVNFRLDRRQALKFVIYSLLLVNFSLYVGDDIEAASHAMRNGGSLLEWTASFATTIDIFAWFTLLFLFELETYVLSDQVQSRPWVMRTFHGVRLLCYTFLAHSIYAFGTIYFDLLAALPVDGVADVCQLAQADISFIRNLEYSVIDASNCALLSTESRFYFTEPGLVVTDASGLALEINLALVDWLEVIFWLLILLTIEVMVQLQDRAITQGMLVTSIKAAKIFLYTSLWAMAAYWVSLGHYYFAWDEALWIIGFLAIESNMSEWKKEIESEPELARNNTNQSANQSTLGT